MGYRKFSQGEYQQLRCQHNIMVLVGNGFDIRVTQRYGSQFSPRYRPFYHYLASRDFGASNLVVGQMATSKQQGLENWSDIEAAIEHLLSTGSHSADEVYKSTVEIQAAFSEYLELVAPPELLARIGKRSETGALAVQSMACFIGDVATFASTFDSFEFPRNTDHYDLFNFLFVNFNYTPLLDDYIFRDAAQFKPQAHRYADRNFNFYPNPTNRSGGYGNEQTGWSSYLRSEVIHPHGQQSIPRSLLFGIDAPDGFDRGGNAHRNLMKPYWAMNDIEYDHLFLDTRLFIVFGCSLGQSDGWWWRRIYRALNDQADDEASRSELIIYWWNPGKGAKTREDVLELFFSVSAVGASEVDRIRAAERIHVVLYGDGDEPIFLRPA